jgi:hypothetical protein
MDCNKQWSSRPDDERFASLHEMLAHLTTQREFSREAVVSSRKITAIPADDHRGLMIAGPNGNVFAPTHHAFGQLANLAGAPAGYLRELPAELAADCLNYGLQYERDIQDVGVLLYKNGQPILRAATGPRYGRIWNRDIVRGLTQQFGDGITGRFRVPGEFGKAVDVTKSNTTLFAGDRDMFVFLADEQNRIDLPGRRDGKTGSLARGFFVWNSEVGAATFGIKAFLFDYVCCNRIVWGAENVEEVRIRHTASAPDRYLEELQPALLAYANSSASSVKVAIENARAARIDDIDDFLAKRFGARTAPKIKAAHLADEGRPIETAWDAVTGVTAYARSIPFQDARIILEEEAGKILQAA